MNQYETQLMAELFKARGWEIGGEEDVSDAYVVNTCTVTALSDRKSRQYIRRMKRLNPQAAVIVMGCYPQTRPEALASMEEADVIIGTEGKERAPELAEEFLKTRERKLLTSGGRPESREYTDHQAIFGSESRTRALIKIEEGCDRFCSYCVIPYARGPVRSRPLESIVSEARGLVEAGYKEIVLSGINTALYGSERPDVSVSGIDGVIEAISALPGDFRIRIGSLEPTVVNADYVKKLFGYDKLCHHLHLSVQSGSDRVLKAMNRHYSAAEYLDIVRVLREFDPLYGITTDIIAGFPGESEEDFEQTLELAEKAGYLHIHGFPYSVRPFTKAAEMEGQLPPHVKKERNARLGELSEKLSLEFRKSMEGSFQRVLTEERVSVDGREYIKGHASNYCPVYIPAEAAITDNEFIDVRAGEPIADGVAGIIVRT